MRRRLSPRGLSVILGALGCAAGATGAGLRWSALARGPNTTVPVAGGAPAAARFDQALASRFEALRAENQDLTYPGLVNRLALARAPEAGPSFDPTGVAYWKKIRDGFALTAKEQEIYRRSGVVGVDQGQRYSMASAYLAIYRRDLPVLITTDSILHALHRSFDSILMWLETSHFYPSLVEALGKAHQQLRKESAAFAAPPLRQAAEDVDLYLTVARNLLAESEEEKQAFVRCALEAEGCDGLSQAAPTGKLQIDSAFGQDARVREVLAAIAARKAAPEPALYGRDGVVVDWSQFTTRGHYNRSSLLQHYFRALMWLGRVDLGFVLAPSDGAFGGHDARRERLDAVTLAWLLRQAGYLGTLAAMDHAIGFMVGLTDNVTIGQMAAAAERAGVRGFPDLADTAKVERVLTELAKSGAGGQRIRSQMGARPPGGGAERPLPDVLQVFGQRFILDSFFLSKVVFDSIDFKGVRQQRTMPTGLDVVAALGNDEAVALLEPQLAKWNYAANLLAARKLVEERPPAFWNASLYDIWLSALAKLDDVPAGALPEVMRGRPWQHKQLQTQLASWAELRHDTILYAKQSYTMGIICEYPTGYVEPYPEAYARLALFGEEANRRLGELQLTTGDIVTFLTRFAEIMRKLEGLARKELAGKPFTKEERQWVKDAIDAKTEDGGGCGGPPRVIYTGWYPKLIFGKPEVWEPTIADVHTDPNSGQVLEVGVGDANFIVAAIDNHGDRAAYVGPVYSYYELKSKERLTDEAWRKRLADGKAPPRPAWTASFQAPPKVRAIDPRQ